MVRGRNYVFLSYCRQDRDVMRRTKAVLQRAGLDVWTDEHLEEGTPWRREIEHAVEAADSLVVILSPDAKKSSWVEAEVGYALAHGVPVFPVLARGSENTAVPLSLITYQYADITGIGSEVVALASLARKLASARYLVSSRPGYAGDDHLRGYRYTGVGLLPWGSIIFVALLTGMALVIAVALLTRW